MCQFHQVQIIIIRYLTRKPELEVSKKLMGITRLLIITDKYSFICMYEEWREKRKDFIKDRGKRQ
jgi:hypothetical protein